MAGGHISDPHFHMRTTGAHAYHAFPAARATRTPSPAYACLVLEPLVEAVGLADAAGRQRTVRFGTGSNYVSNPRKTARDRAAYIARHRAVAADLGGGAFIKSALGSGIQQTAAVLAAQGGQTRMMVRSKAPDLPIIVNVGVVLIRAIKTRARRTF